MIESPIKARRKAMGLSEDDVALLVGVNPLCIHRWEEGHALPSEKRMVQLAEVLGITREMLREELGQFYEARGNKLIKLLRAG